MRIAIATPYSWSHPGGVNNHVSGLSRQLAELGHDVTIIAPDAAGADGDAAPASRRLVSDAGGSVDAVMVDAGRSVPLPANGSIARLALLPGSGGRVRRALSSGDFDVVHVHEPLVPLVSSAAVMAAPRKVVGTFHAAGDGRSLTYLFGATLMGRVARRLDRRIAVSVPARALASRYLPGEYRIIPNGVDVSRFSPGARGGPLDAGPSILFVGRNEKRKGLDVLLEAFPLICEKVEGCRLEVVGSGFDTCDVLSRVPGALREQVSVSGFVANEELPEKYASATVFCAPALGAESFGIVLVESMAAGTPVVASDIPGYSAVLEQAGGGVLFRRGDPADLARALVDVLADSALREELAGKGLSGVGRFAWPAVAERLLEVYAD